MDDKKRIALLEDALAAALYWLPATVVVDGIKRYALPDHWDAEDARAARDRIERDTGVRGNG